MRKRLKGENDKRENSGKGVGRHDEVICRKGERVRVKNVNRGGKKKGSASEQRRSTSGKVENALVSEKI